MTKETKAAKPKAKRADATVAPESAGIDLGITEGGIGKPSMAEVLYADRIAVGDTPMPEGNDPTFTAGVRQALEARQAVPTTQMRHLAHLSVSVPAAAVALAQELHYDGEVTLGAVEDRARIYQRRTAEDAIELGKCLLLIKEMAPHGEFLQRIEMLCIPGRTAQRFMQAAAKISRNGHLADLAKRVKSLSAVLELVTADDEVLEDLSSMDDIDCLTATELKNRLRQSEESINRLQTDLDTAQSRLTVEAKTLPPPLLSREADQHLQKSLNAEAMGAAALDLLKRQVVELETAGDYLEERAMTLHSCLSALASRVSLALTALKDCADLHAVDLPPRPQMVVSESMARDYLAAHTGYIETAIELAQKALIARSDVIGRGRGRPAGSKNRRKGDAA